MSQKTPRPTTRQALLPSAGYGQIGGRPRVTTHMYVDTRECVDADGTASFEHVFACEETGEERRWGVEHRRASTSPLVEDAN